MSSPEPPDTDPLAAASRAAPQWAESTRPAELGSSVFAATRFDPVAEERVRLQAQVTASFDVCQPALALRVVLGVQAVLAVAALAGASSLGTWLPRQASLSFGGLLATLLWLVVICSLRHRMANWIGVARASGVVACGGLAAAVAWLPLAALQMADDDLFSVSAVILCGLGLALVLWAWLDLRARIWHPANASARLAELQSRIRPHFLFNTLNTALALVRIDPARAESVLEDLAQLFRVALAEVGAAVTLEEEIDLARRYLAIEEVRFGPRLQVTWQIDRRVFAAVVPPLVLQPLVENAVRHGIEPVPGGGQVVISARLQRGQVIVTVSNTVGDDPGSPGHGMALHNVRERLRLLHDVAAQCEVWRETGEAGEARSAGATDAVGSAGAAGAADGQRRRQDHFHARITLPAP